MDEKLLIVWGTVLVSVCVSIFNVAAQCHEQSRCLDRGTCMVVDNWSCSKTGSTRSDNACSSETTQLQIFLLLRVEYARLDKLRHFLEIASGAQGDGTTQGH